ncbi:aldehyde dehydrogenase family protein [Rhodococcus erythropolis]|uniref:aldehyde dehydrogenase family protein n=1 Tax=Rhodococcus erythropolis TaxID=1833 RepID=UPI001BE7A36A|nr:aldehyde dehydrogenase family protein [Rhodococcus erythropolis]MBT2266110.1 aldehyde dehydrogenase family protein [Rhodococcus erythropolis]
MMTTSFSPRDGRVLGEVGDTSADQLASIVAAATTAAPAAADVAPAVRRRWLDAIADAIDQHAGELIKLADSETALGVPRLTGEVNRVAEQLRFYGRVAADGAYLGVVVDDSTPIAPRLVRINRPLGPVAVFGASNFPFAFGVVGNDTASALAAGCPVVAKAHPAHVLTSVRLAEIATAALTAAGAPAGLFDLVSGLQVGVDLVRTPEIKAVGFTGSQGGGLALWKIANEREIVIPVYAEMGTVNPVVVTPAGAADLAEIAKGFVGSFTLGSGQFCSKPGLLFAPKGSDAGRVVADVLTDVSPTPYMLTSAIAANVTVGVHNLVEAGASVVTRLAGPGTGWSAESAVLTAPISALVPGSKLLEEVFGPVAVVVEYSDAQELHEALGVLQGSLAGSVFGGGDNDPDLAATVSALAGQVGRVTVGDWPTGVAWSWAQQHGGPWPSTSNPATTSVGAAALDRFVRPIAYQSVPDGALPAGTREAVDPANPWHIPRRINGKLELA